MWETAFKSDAQLALWSGIQNVIILWLSSVGVLEKPIAS